MTTYVAFLRGINVAGKKKFPKAEQLQLLSDLELTNPKVYLHTGNWIFESPMDREDVARSISEAIQKTYQWEVPILVKTVDETEQILSRCPFPEGEIEKSYFTVLHTSPEEELIVKVNQISYSNESFYLTSSCVYFYSSHGYGNAKLNNNWFEKKLQVSATTRNFNTLTKVLALAKE